MAITGTHMKVQIRYEYLGQKCMQVAHYRLNGAAFLTADVNGVLEAYWDNIKADWRALLSTSTAVSRTVSLYGEEVGGSGGYAEYAIPDAEQPGTRSAGDDGEWLPGFVDCGVRLTVPTKLTRPGQKRFPFVREGDISGNTLGATYLGLVATAATIFSASLILGAPVATGEMKGAVGGTVVGGVATVFQDISGRVVNTTVTSQVSRRAGHGT